MALSSSFQSLLAIVALSASFLFVSLAQAEEEVCLSNDGSITTCPSSSSSRVVTVEGYDNFQRELQEVWHDERPETCDSDEFWELEWKTLQTMHSQYQHVEFCQDPRNDDMCLDLDSIIQICASYRPHYHELMVHYPTQYLPTLKRVAFIGGGDAMLLHEVLKYPSLELVIGLELDQQVTRGSFKYFGSQPHWEDPRVEWWFGDATKTLRVLPHDYYGSFDLVLVDLSETVMALSVTDELDVMQALSLLLQPNGILVQNEIMHFLEVASAFQHTIHSHFYNVPIVCSQSIVFGSHGLDFLRQTLTHHNVTYFLTDPLDDPLQLSTLIHDYQRNSTNARGNCRRQRRNTTKHNEDHVAVESHAGVIMVIDVEGLESSQWSNDLWLQNSFRAAAKQVDLNVESMASSRITRSTDSEDWSITSVTVVLQEGYVVAHCVPELQYCALDVHMWTRLDVHDEFKKAFVASLRGNNRNDEKTTLSTFRIVAGGMLGTKGGEVDRQSRGPLSVPVCGDENDSQAPLQQQQNETDAKMMHNVLQYTFKLVEGKDVSRVAVLCNTRGTPCPMLASLNENKQYELLELWACPNLKDLTQETASTQLLACETEVTKTINDFVSQQKSRLDAIVVDENAPFAMGQILIHLFGSKMRQKRMLADRRLVISTLKSSWQPVFVDRFRTEVFKEEPLFRTEIAFNQSNTTTSSFGVMLVSSGDEYFVNRLTSLLPQLEHDLGLVSKVQNIRGSAIFNSVSEDMFHAFTHLDYNQREPYEQWQSQRQVFRQTVFQFSVEETATSTPITPDGMKISIQKVISSVTESEDSPDMHWVMESTKVGSGMVVAALWDDGSIVVVWDGDVHVDANCLTFEDDDRFATQLSEELQRAFNLNPTLTDMHPRGIGRVVNWHEDSEGYVPLWASAIATDSSETATT